MRLPANDTDARLGLTHHEELATSRQNIAHECTIDVVLCVKQCPFREQCNSLFRPCCHGLVVFCCVAATSDWRS